MKQVFENANKVLGKKQKGEGEMRGQRELINVKPREKPKKSIPKKAKKLPKKLPKRVMPMQRRPQRPNNTGRSGSLRRGEMEELENSVPAKKSIQPGM